MSLEKTYIQYGVPSNWANHYNQIGISTKSFKNTSKTNLITKYKIPELQINFVKNCLTRQPIEEDIVQKILENNSFTCCLCKGIKSDAYIIHHIVEYSQTKDNKYNNLALLCPNDHDLAHREGTSLTNKISKKQIKLAKKNWENQVKSENKKAALNKIPQQKLYNWKKENIYKELQSFSESDKEYFFGRNIEIEELLIKINKYNIVGLFGESGTGKTSLINAGLIPNLKKEGFITIPIRCLDEPIRRIREGLIKSLKEKNISIQLIDDLSITDTFAHLIISLKSIIEKENLNLIIVIDQFEELFTKARETEREHLSKGIIEALIPSNNKGKLFFLLSLREDYIGELWDWSHLYDLEDAWIHQYRIKKLTAEKAFDAITFPLQKLGIKIDNEWVNQIILELRNIGDGLIYPPYLQIVCSALFTEYKKQNTDLKPIIEFNQNIFQNTNIVESIITDYLSESMLHGLTEEEKIYAQNILDLLTGPEGLRAFLNIEEISKYLSIKEINAKHVLEHLIKKKIVHPIVESDKVAGYELVHDFLSKKFFDKLGPDAKKAKTTIEIFRKAFKEWKQHGVLASKDRLEILFQNINQLILNDDEWTFLIKSSFSVYWYFENKWIEKLNNSHLTSICLKLIEDKEERIIESSIGTLGKIKNTDITPTLIEIIESSKSSISVRDTALHQFSYYLVDERIINVLKHIITQEKNHKLRKTAVSAFGNNISRLSIDNKKIIENEINILFIALNDSMTQVRKQAADILSYSIISEQSVEPLIKRLKIENSISSRKAIVSALASLLRKNISSEIIIPILEEIFINNKEDYRVREEARYAIQKN